MVIELTETAFQTQDFKSFNLLFQVCTIKDRYEIFADYVKIKDSAIFKRLDFSDQELILRNFDAQITKQSNKKAAGKNLTSADYYITLGNHETPNLFNIEEATIFFNQKVSIILENSLNDSHFVKAIIAYFDQVGTLKTHLANNWLGFENAGGCTNVENFVNGKLHEFNGLPKENKHYYRAFVLLDSDRESPKQHLHKKHNDLLAFLRKNNLNYHVLEKRMMENYMPDEVINAYTDAPLRPWINSFLHLSDRQKDFLNFTKGFSKKNGDGTPIKKRLELEEDIIELHGDISDKNYEILDQGFKLQDFKSKFPLNFIENPLVNAASLNQKIKHQENPDEFKEILSKIFELI